MELEQSKVSSLITDLLGLIPYKIENCSLITSIGVVFTLFKITINGLNYLLLYVILKTSHTV